MRTCYYHPKLEAVANCRSCKLPSCFHCLENEYCPECVKLRRYIELGYSGPRRPNLVPTPRVRSKTMELMIQRLQVHAVDADAASRKYSKSTSPRKPIKMRKPVGFGLLLPGLAPMIKVTRSPLSQIALVAVAVFGLSTFFAQPHKTMAEPVAPAPVAEAEAPLTLELAPIRTSPIRYRPVFVFVNQAPAAIATPAPVSQALIRYAPVVMSHAEITSETAPPIAQQEVPSDEAAGTEHEAALASETMASAQGANP